MTLFVKKYTIPYIMLTFRFGVSVKISVNFQSQCWNATTLGVCISKPRLL